MQELELLEETTLDLYDNREVFKVTGVYSFQNRSPNDIYWSTDMFSDTNRGSILRGESECMFSGPTTIYLMASKDHSSVQLRNVRL